MKLSLAQIAAVAELAEHLYDYLPGSSAWRGTYTLSSAATEAGLAEYWQGGSKLPALTNLLERALRNSPGLFCKLVLRIVENGLKYRRVKKRPLRRQDIETLNRLLVKVGFKIPELWAPSFLARLPAGEPSASVSGAPRLEVLDEQQVASARGETVRRLEKVFLDLVRSLDRQGAGLALERLLGELFGEFGLQPERAFRVVGEQIDGSFVLDNEVYLLEAKWTKQATREGELLAFRGKVEGKASFARGLFLSVNGFTGEALASITSGKQPLFIMMDGADLYRVLSGHVDLVELLRRKVRRLAETGRPFIPVSELFAH